MVRKGDDKRTDEAGSIVGGYQYDAYGRQAVITDNGVDNTWFTDDDTLEVNGDSAVDNPYMFQGRRFDEETQMQYFRNRYYNSRLGRFISRDPMGVWFDIIQYGNGYGSFHNSSINYSDPLGLQFPPDFKSDYSVDAHQEEPKKVPGVKIHTQTMLPIDVGIYETTWIEVKGDEFHFIPLIWQLDSKVENYPGAPSDTASAIRRDKGKLRGGDSTGKKCCCASDEEIEDCAHSVAESLSKNEDLEYYLISYNCGDFVRDVLDKCCLKAEIPWSCTFQPYGPMHRPYNDSYEFGEDDPFSHPDSPWTDEHGRPWPGLH